MAAKQRTMPGAEAYAWFSEEQAAKKLCVYVYEGANGEEVHATEVSSRGEYKSGWADACFLGQVGGFLRVERWARVAPAASGSDGAPPPGLVWRALVARPKDEPRRVRRTSRKTGSGSAPPGSGSAPPDSGAAASEGGSALPDSGAAASEGGSAPPESGAAASEGGSALPESGAAASEGGSALPESGAAASEGGSALPESGAAASEGGSALPGSGAAASEGGSALPGSGASASEGGGALPESGAPPPGLVQKTSSGASASDSSNFAEKYGQEIDLDALLAEVAEL